MFEPWLQLGGGPGFTRYIKSRNGLGLGLGLQGLYSATNCGDNIQDALQ